VCKQMSDNTLQSQKHIEIKENSLVTFNMYKYIGWSAYGGVSW